jgi:hypothetical protein
MHTLLYFLATKIIEWSDGEKKRNRHRGNLIRDTRDPVTGVVVR